MVVIFIFSSAPVNSQTASTAGAAASVPTTTASTESGQDRACTPPLSVYSADTLVPLQVSSQPEENEEDSTPALSEGNVIGEFSTPFTKEPGCFQINIT